MLNQPTGRVWFRGVCQGRVVSDLTDLRDRMRQFTDDRDWGQFHDPKSLILALTGEVGELAELFQWLPAAEAADLARAEPLHSRVGEEISDVLLYLIRLADVVGLDLIAAVDSKLAAAESRFDKEVHYGVAPPKS